MARNIFVSFNFKDKALAGTIEAMREARGQSVPGRFVWVENDVSAGGDPAIDREIRRVMAGCDSALFCIGDNSHNSPWIEREAALAESLDLKVVVARLPGTSGGLPARLRRAGHAEVRWNPLEINQAFNRT